MVTSTIPWIEKYRPKSISEVTSQSEVVGVLKNAINSPNLPHMLFYGPPGTGKTSTILALARDIFGQENFKSRVLELNASDERGINVVREKIKTFAKASVSSGGSSKIPAFKIIVLDEADSMTPDAQAALRRVMEQYSKITRFCLVCNYITRIIEPIASRCAKFRFTALDKGEMVKKLSSIASTEQIAFSDDACVEKLVEVSDGDMRRAIMYLQSMSQLKIEKEITVQDVFEISGLIPSEIITHLAEAWKSKQSFKSIKNKVDEIRKSGYSGAQVMDQLFDYIMSDVELPEKDKNRVALRFMELDKCLADGCDEYVQLLKVLC